MKTQKSFRLMTHYALNNYNNNNNKLLLQGEST